MRRFKAMLARDAVLAWRNGQVAVTLAVMALMILLVLFLPAELRGAPRELALDESEGLWFASSAVGAALDLATDRADFQARLADGKSAVGIVFGGSAERPTAELHLGAGVSAENARLTEAVVDELVRRALGSSSEGRFPVGAARAGVPRAPLNLRGIPVFLIFEVGILGFLLVAVFVFQEKAEGTIRAYRASPGGAFAYTGAKASVFVLMSALYGAGIIAAALAKGLRPDLPYAFAVIVAASATMTCLGLGFATFFDNLSQWFFPGLGALVVNILPIFAYSIPGFSPAWLKAVPSYDALFMMSDALFAPGARPEPAAAARAALWLLGSAAFCLVAVKARLLKESK